MLSCKCHCGRVQISTKVRPEFVNACNCSLCRKIGALWGYFSPSEVTVSGTTASYKRVDKDEPAVEVHFCASCGSTTHFLLTEGAIALHGNTMMGVNASLFDQAELAGVELRFPDGLAWTGIGEFSYRRAPEVIGG